MATYVDELLELLDRVTINLRGNDKLTEEWAKINEPVQNFVCEHQEEII